MANGKIFWSAPPRKSLILGGIYFLTLDDSNFNMDTSDFAVDVLVKTYDVSEEWVWVIGKGPDILDGERGWNVWINGIDKYVWAEINDGQPTPQYVTTDENRFQFNDWIWLRVAFDRDGDCIIWINGNVAASGSISGRQGSVNNNDPLYAGAHEIGLLRIDRGRLLDADYVAREWQRLQYGLSPRPQDFLAVWLFNGTLVDESGQYDWDWNPSGSPVYGTNFPNGMVQHHFPINYELGWTLEYLGEADFTRALDGSLTAYWLPGRRRRRLTLPFRYVAPAQVDALLAAYESGAEIHCWLDGRLPKTMIGLIVEPPLVTASSPGWYDLILVLEEV